MRSFKMQTMHWTILVLTVCVMILELNFFVLHDDQLSTGQPSTTTNNHNLNPRNRSSQRSQGAVEKEQHTLRDQLEAKEEEESSSVPNQNPEAQKLSKSDIFFGLTLSDDKLAKAIMWSWGRQFGEKNIRFFTCRGAEVDPEIEKYVIRSSQIHCNQDEEKSWGAVLQHMASQHWPKWFVHACDDIYVNVPRLVEFLASIKYDDDTRAYLGSVGEKQTDFVKQGPGIFMSKPAVHMLQPELRECVSQQQEKKSSLGSQLGKCFAKVGIRPNEVEFKTSDGKTQQNMDFNHLFRNFRRTSSSNNAGVEPFKGSTVPSLLSSKDISTIIVAHSVKDPLLMYRHHAHISYYTTPVDVVWNNTSPELKEMKRKEKCVNNPEMVKVMTSRKGIGYNPYITNLSEYKQKFSMEDFRSFHLPECPIKREGSMNAKKIDAAYIICMDKERCARTTLYNKLKEIGINAIIHPATVLQKHQNNSMLSAGERAYRLSYRDVMVTALKAKQDVVMIYDEDALLHKDIDKKLDEILQCKRCSCMLDGSCSPGMLFLGVTCWASIMLERYQKQTADFLDCPCANWAPQSYGSFAMLYNTRIFPHIIHWLDSAEIYPLDWVFSYMSMEGFVVRVLVPPLVIMDVGHTSNIKKREQESMDDGTAYRYKLHGWNPQEHLNRWID